MVSIKFQNSPKISNSRQHFLPLIRFTCERAGKGGGSVNVQTLYTQFYKELIAYAVTLTKERSTAEDLVQETFLRAMLQMADTDRAVNRSWLYKTVRNLFIDQRRKHSRETFSDDEQMACIPFEQDLSRSAVAQLVARLPEAERVLFILRHFEGYNASELGEMFSLPPATVRARLASARRRLRSFLAQ